MTYVLNTDEAARKRLNLQHALYEAHSLKMLALANIKKGSSGLEIGCGTGVMTYHLAKLIGDKGKLVSIDINQAQLETASAFIKSKNINNVVFKQCDIYDINKLDKQYDFIYCRMVLHHLADAKEALDLLVDCLIPGGMLICEEPIIHEGFFSYPHTKPVERFFNICKDCLVRNETDYTIAYKIEHILLEKGLTIKAYELFQPLLKTKEEKCMHMMVLQDLKPQILTLGIETEDGLEKLKIELSSLAEENATAAWLRMHSLVAVKPY